MWTQALAPEATLFQAVTHRSAGVYANDPPPPVTTTNDNNNEVDEENGNEDSSMNPIHSNNTNQNNNHDEVDQPHTSVLASWFVSSTSTNSDRNGPRYRPVSQ